MRTPEQRRRLFLFVTLGVAIGALTTLVRHRGSPPPPAARALDTPEPGPAPRSVSPTPPRAPAAIAAPPAPPPPSPPPTPRSADTDEAHALARVRDTLRDRPDEALALLDTLDHAHPRDDDPLAEERAVLRVDALVYARRIGPARDAAEAFLQRYPQSPRAQHVEILTGVHPRPTDLDN